MLNDLLSRRGVLRAAALAAGSAAVLAGCDDSPAATGKPGSRGADGTAQAPEPSTDPAVVAALTLAATQVAQIAQRYSAVSRAFPALRPRLATGIKHRATQTARLKQVGGFQTTPPPGKLPPLPKTAAAALADLASREQKLSVTHATAATKLSGEAARLLAMLAASESQLAITLSRKAAR